MLNIYHDNHLGLHDYADICKKSCVKSVANDCFVVLYVLLFSVCSLYSMYSWVMVKEEGRDMRCKLSLPIVVFP